MINFPDISQISIFKALANLFGRQVLVFNCDEGIDVYSMSRIFIGLVQCGAWGCFDEFNRLDQADYFSSIKNYGLQKSKIIDFRSKIFDIHDRISDSAFGCINANSGYSRCNKVTIREMHASWSKCKSFSVFSRVKIS